MALNFSNFFHLVSSGGSEPLASVAVESFLVSLYVVAVVGTKLPRYANFSHVSPKLQKFIALEYKIKLNRWRKENKQKIAFRFARKNCAKSPTNSHVDTRGILLSKRCYATAQILTQTIPLAFLFISLRPRPMISFYIRLARVTQLPVNYLFCCSFCVVDSLCNYLPFLRQFSASFI